MTKGGILQKVPIALLLNIPHFMQIMMFSLPLDSLFPSKLLSKED